MQLCTRFDSVSMQRRPSVSFLQQRVVNAFSGLRILAQLRNAKRVIDVHSNMDDASTVPIHANPLSTTSPPQRSITFVPLRVRHPCCPFAMMRQRGATVATLFLMRRKGSQFRARPFALLHELLGLLLSSFAIPPPRHFFFFLSRQLSAG